MKLTELFNPLTEGYYDPEQDKIFKQSMDEKHKPKLTLRSINKMKKIRATRKLEDVKHQETVKVMYGGGGGQEDDMGGF